MLLSTAHHRTSTEVIAELIAAKDTRIAELEAEKVQLENVVALLRATDSDLSDQLTKERAKHEESKHPVA